MVMPTTTDFIEAIKTQIGSVRAFIQERDKVTGEEMARLSKQVLEVTAMLKDERRAKLLTPQSGGVPHVPHGLYVGFTPGQLYLASQFLSAAKVKAATEVFPDPEHKRRLERWQANLTQAVSAIAPFIPENSPLVRAAAMDSTTAGYGDELVPTAEDNELWMDVNLRTALMDRIRITTMPTNPFDLPLQLGNVNFYPTAEEGTTVTETRLATVKKTLTAYKVMGIVPWTEELREDTVINMIREVTSAISRNGAELIEDLLLNADTSATNGINSDEATIAKTDAAKGHWLIGFDGLLHAGIIDNTAMLTNHAAAAPSDAMFTTQLALLGKYAVNPTEVVHVMDPYTYLKCLGITQVRTLDLFGPQATILNGQLGAHAGIPVIVSGLMLKAAADGKVTDGVAGTLGRMLTVNTTQWRMGFRRPLTVEVVPEPLKDQTSIKLSLRMALGQRATLASQTHTAVTRNILI